MTDARSVRIMGILNVTPDSFSDGGRFDSLEAARAQAEKLISDGADILDIGGESTRPYAEPVSLNEELSRVVPVIEAIRSVSSIPISIDTYKAEVARQALAAGADIINDVTALQGDPDMIDVVAGCGNDVIIMHMQGTPGSMQDNPTRPASLSIPASGSAKRSLTTCSCLKIWTNWQNPRIRSCSGIPENVFSAT